jgi:hypothetical protein
MPIKRQENVVELQITVDDAVLVEVFQRKANLSGINSYPVSTLLHSEYREYLLSSFGAEVTSLNVQH